MSPTTASQTKRSTYRHGDLRRTLLPKARRLGAEYLARSAVRGLAWPC